VESSEQDAVWKRGAPDLPPFSDGILFSNKVKKGARFFIFGNSRNSEIGRAQDFCVKTNKSQ
jgi:hypothetical protein